MSYNPPVRDLTFAITELAGLEKITLLPGFEEVNTELLTTILDEAGRFSAEVLAPINHSGDRQGVRLENGRAITADGWKEAYRKFVEAGWNSLPFDPKRGGQGLPWLIATAVQEIWHAANMSFSLCPLLTQGVVEALQAHASEELKERYLEQLISGVWTGTMNLTESQAGSDLSSIQTRAEPQGEHYLLFGQKIFITYGDHDLADNIIHMVLARTPDAPAGVKGISLFLVPTMLPDADGEHTLRNDIETASLEKKLGIHACPTAVLRYGPESGAVGYLIGEENQGLRCMFTMMNLARHAVGVEANGVSERAYQQAVEYARQRVQGRPVEQPDADRVTIIQHPDIKRLLLLQKSRIEALRSLSLVNAAAMDIANHSDDPQQKLEAGEWVELLTPIVKGYTTEIGLENVSLAVQVHGGMGFIEETGIAQHYRDQRITPIYEGTTGIQAMDLVGRKLTRDDGAMTERVIQRIRTQVEQITAEELLTDMRRQTLTGLDKLSKSARRIIRLAADDARLPAAVGEPYLRLWGVVTCGWQMLQAAAVASARLEHSPDDDFYINKVKTAQFYFATEMPRVDYLCTLIASSGEIIAHADEALFNIG